MKEVFASNPDYREFEAKLLCLARMMANGDGSSDDADAVREEMADLWPKLSQAEQDRLHGLSGDLYMITDSELYDRPLSEVVSPGELTNEAQAAFRREDWLGLLSVVRQGPLSSPKHVVASLRSMAYERLGHLESALVFLEYGRELEPHLPYFESHAMDLLRRLGRVGDAFERALRHLRSTTTGIETLVQSALMLLMLRDKLSDRENIETAQLITKRLPPRLRDQRPTSPVSVARISSGYYALGGAYESINEPDKALAAYDSALRIDPRDEQTLLTRGLLRLRLGRSDAIEDFEAAAAGSSRSPLAYVVLARNALGSGDYRRCLRLCDQLTFMLTDGEILATVLLWRAFAELRLGMPREVVIGTLQMAHALWPANTSIDHLLASAAHADKVTIDVSSALEEGREANLTPDQLSKLGPSPRDRLMSADSAYDMAVA